MAEVERADDDNFRGEKIQRRGLISREGKVRPLCSKADFNIVRPNHIVTMTWITNK